VRPPHALLLAGPAGVGKTTLALDLAAGLLCLSPDPAARPCRTCAACRKVAHGNHPDLHRIGPEGAGGQIRLPQVQALATALVLLPMEGRLRVAIVEHADQLNPDAQNAFLKTLEEPPAGVCLVLAVDDEAALLPTVRSRCARLRLGPVSGPAIAELLAERGLADASRAATLARAATGRPGVALALASQPEATIVEGRLARRLLDLVDADRRTRLATAAELLADGGALAEALERGLAGARAPESEASTQDGAPPPASRTDAPASGARGAARGASPAERRRAALRILDTWRGVCRDLAVASVGGRAELRHIELLEEILDAARRVPAADWVTFLARLDLLTAAIETYANPELSLDTLLLGWPRAEREAA
jgi:DNA polymerase III delta' subunit